jgi:Fe2+ transport system protein B
VASNLERNLYITTELIDMSQPVVVALNMYDELEASGAELDFEQLGKMVGVPMVPVIAKTGRGIENLLRTVLRVFLNEDKTVRHVHILYRENVEVEINMLSKLMKKDGELPLQFPPRYWAIKMLEADEDIRERLKNCHSFEQWDKAAASAIKRIERNTGENVENVISSEKYGFIDGALKETYIPGKHELNRKTIFIDKLVTNRWLGFPIFFF